MFEKTREILARENETLKAQIEERNVALVDEQNSLEKILADWTEKNQADKKRLEALQGQLKTGRDKREKEAQLLRL